MPINPNCFAALQRLGLPMRVTVHDRTGNQITTAEIAVNGTIIDLTTGIQYRHPSHLRAVLIEANGQTYTRLRLNGTDLRTLGVHP